jgi:hypothetical protein
MPIISVLRCSASQSILKGGLILEIGLSTISTSYGSREGVSWVACHIIQQHKDDLRVGNAQPLDCSVQGHLQGVPTTTTVCDQGAAIIKWSAVS